MNSSFTILFLVASFLLVSCDHDLLEISEKIDNASCIRASYSSALVRGYLSTGMVDPNLKSNIAALTAVMVPVNIYMNPCVKCGNASGQIDAIYNVVGESHKMVGIYVFGDQWGKDKQANKKFLLELVMSVMSHSTLSFIITNKYQWEKIIGEAIMSLILAPVIYIKVDHKATCDDYDPFGCWTEPVGKKYESDRQVCNMKVGVINSCEKDSNGIWDRLMGVHA